MEFKVSDLVNLLTSQSSSVKLGALQLISSLSADSEGRAQLSEESLVVSLLRFVGDSNFLLVKEAVTALINLTQTTALAEIAVRHHAISQISDSILHASEVSESLIPLYAMLLSNITRTQSGSRSLLQLDDPGLEGYHFSKLLLLFLKWDEAEAGEPDGPSSRNSEGRDNCSWVGAVMHNATMIEEGREIFTKNDAHWLRMLFPFISSKSLIRRRSVLGMIKNCLFNVSTHKTILENKELNLVTELCLHLRGNEVFKKEDLIGMPERLAEVPTTKKRDEDMICVELILDILRLLTSTLFGRDFLRSNQVYPILRELDKVIEGQTLSEKIYDLVYILMLNDGSGGSRPLYGKVSTQADLDEYGREIEQL